MSQTCDRHAKLPVIGQSPCAGCEIERLRAEKNRLVALLECSQGDCRQAMRMVDGLQKDAERYRYLANRTFFVSGSFHTPPPEPINGSNPLKGSVAQHFEEAIDAAMSKDPLADKGQ